MASRSQSAWGLFRCFVRLGATAFGGPAMVARIRELAVVRRRWISADAFDVGVALCQTVPGATAMQCAAYVGLYVRGVAGALAAFVGFGLPAFLLMLTASIAYARVSSLLAAQAALSGLRTAVVAIVVNAAVDVARVYLKSCRDCLIAAVGAALLLIESSPVLVVGAAALGGLFLSREGGTPNNDTRTGVPTWVVARRVGVSLLTATTLVLALLACCPRLASLALAMMKVDTLAFGGGFSTLPLMFSEFVRPRGTLAANTFMDGVALGQVTPGPIVITATFVGYRIGGLVGALVATASVFFPSFTMVIAAAPWFERLSRHAHFQAAIRGATLSFVGLLAVVALRFGASMRWGLVQGMLAVGALVALRLRVGIVWVVLGAGLLGTVFSGH